MAIAISSIGIIALGAFVSVLLFKDASARKVPNVVNVGAREDIAEEFSFGRPEIIAGTSDVRVPLRRQQTYSDGRYYSGSFGPKRTDQIVNYVFLNTSTNESRWLFESAGQLILESHVLYRQLKHVADDSRESVGIVYVVVDRDSNGDNRLSEKDAVSLIASGVDGANARKLVEGIEELYSIQQIADDKVLVLYLKNKQTVSEVYGVPAMLSLNRAYIPKVGLK